MVVNLAGVTTLNHSCFAFQRIKRSNKLWEKVYPTEDSQTI